MPLIKTAFPSDLQAVIKPSTIFTARGSWNSDFTATEDEVFLLAEYEVYGAARHASTQEPNYLKQYSYYAAGNSRVKYRHNSTGSAVNWWERSPAYENSYGFCYVGGAGDGGASNAYAVNSFGVAPCFKV